MNDTQDTTSSSFIFSGEMKSDWTFSDHKEIASRGVNILYSATHKGCRYLLKGLQTEYRNNEVYEMQMLKEYRLGKSLKHEHVVQTYGMVDDTVAGRCIVMEYIDGCNLGRWLASHPSMQKRHRVFLEILDGLAYCHAKQVIHRDIKPSNIMITSHGENVKLIDFGLSDNDNYLLFKQGGGTKGYMAPEQFSREATADNRTDIYALGSLMGELFPHRFLIVRNHCKRVRLDRRIQNISSLRHKYLMWRRLPWAIVVALLLLLMVVYGIWSTYPRQEVVESPQVVVHDTIAVSAEVDPKPELEEKVLVPNEVDILQEIAEKYNRLYQNEISQCLENEKYNYDIDSELRRRCTMIENNYCASAKHEQHVYIREKSATIQQQLNEQYGNQLHQCRIAIAERNR